MHFMHIAFFIPQFLFSNYAILFNGSCDYHNYRHTSNIKLLYKILISNNFSDNQVLKFCGEDNFLDLRNKFPDFIKLENENIKVGNINCEFGNLNSLLNAIYLNHPSLINCNKSNNFLIYLCGHGNDSFLKILYRESIFKSDLEYAINNLASKVNKVLVIVDTCQASSFIPANIPDNVYYATTSVLKQPSISSYFSSSLGVHSVDNFVYSFYKKELVNESLDDFFKYFTFERIRSDLVTKRNCNEFSVSDFFMQMKREDELLPL